LKFCTTKEDIATDARIDFYILIRAFAAIVFINQSAWRTVEIRGSGKRVFLKQFMCPFLPLWAVSPDEPHPS
jgi:hypothetical protein